MCGIHLIFDKSRQLTEECPASLNNMLHASSYRGPDARGTCSLSMQGGNLHLGSNRLKIIDPNESANQPMSSADGRYWLCFNGTIYNYFELRNELLAQGVKFTTHSDTEVLLYILIHKGAEALNDLNGMFALLFYDQQEQSLLAARDRFGMKPLFYTNNEQYLIFSSEAKSIMSSGLLEKQLYEPAIEDYLHFRYVKPPYTFFSQVFQLMPGHYMEVADEGEPSIHSYLSSLEQLVPGELTEDEVVSETEDLLQDAVLHHLVGDANAGLLLSGGVDSTLLLSLIKELGAHPLPAFSIINTKQEATFGTEDYHYARKAAAMYGSHHYELTLVSSMLLQHREDFMIHIDQPIGDSAAFMTYMLSAEVKKLAGVALSGAGADELFAGYNRHQAYAQYLRHYDTLIKFRGIWKNGSQWLPTGFAHPLRKKFRLLKKLGQSLDKDPERTFINFISQHAFATEERLQAPMLHKQNKTLAFEEHWLGYALEHELQYYLPADILSMSDNMSMAQSLEMRMPYLDLPLANYMRSIPARFRMRHGKKWILKSLLEARGGKVFTSRAKEGFGLPFGHWLRSAEMAGVRQLIKQREQLIYQYISYEQVQNMLQAHQYKQADYSTELWSIWVLASWLNLHFS